MIFKLFLVFFRQNNVQFYSKSFIHCRRCPPFTAATNREKQQRILNVSLSMMISAPISCILSIMHDITSLHSGYNSF